MGVAVSQLHNCPGDTAGLILKKIIKILKIERESKEETQYSKNKIRVIGNNFSFISIKINVNRLNSPEKTDSRMRFFI